MVGREESLSNLRNFTGLEFIFGLSFKICSTYVTEMSILIDGFSCARIVKEAKKR